MGRRRRHGQRVPAIVPIAQEHLGKTIILQNRTGATGAIATTFVANQPADGYSILFGAENPNLYKVTGLSQIDYDQFEPVFLMMANVGVVIVSKDSPYTSYRELIEAAASGKTITMGSTGPGGLPYVATTMIEKIHDVKFNKMQFDGEGPCITASWAAISMRLLSVFSQPQTSFIQAM